MVADSSIHWILAIRRKAPTLFSYNGKALAILKTDKVRVKTRASMGSTVLNSLIS